MLSRDLLMAGAGVYSGKQSGPLVSSFPPVLPFRQGARGEDPAGHVCDGPHHALLRPVDDRTDDVLRELLAPADTSFTPAPAQDGGCATDDPLCGFSKDTTVLVFDGFGNYDLLTITAVNAGTLDVSVNRSSNSTTTTYPAGSKVVEVRSRTYYLKTDAAGKTSQLMRYDGTSNPDVPLVDNVVGLEIRLLRRTAAADDDQAPRRHYTSPDDVWRAARRERRELFVCGSTDPRRRPHGSRRSGSGLIPRCHSRRRS